MRRLAVGVGYPASILINLCNDSGIVIVVGAATTAAAVGIVGIVDRFHTVTGVRSDNVKGEREGSVMSASVAGEGEAFTPFRLCLMIMVSSSSSSRNVYVLSCDFSSMQDAFS